MTIDTSKLAEAHANVAYYNAECDRLQQAVAVALASATPAEIRAICDRRDRERDHREAALLDLAEAVREFLGSVQ